MVLMYYCTLMPLTGIMFLVRGRSPDAKRGRRGQTTQPLSFCIKPAMKRQVR
jgi:hypothetical protein